MAKLDAFVKRTLPDGGSAIETILQVLPGVGVFIAFIVIALLGAIAKKLHWAGLYSRRGTVF